MKQIRVGIFFLLCCFLFIAPAIAEMHVLDMQSVPALDSAGDNEACADYLLEHVELEAVYDRLAEPGTISILNGDRHPIVARKLQAGEQGRINVKLKAADDRTLSRGVIIELLKLDEEDESVSLERTETDTDGRAGFSRAVTPGSYQIAVSCGGPLLAVPALLGAGGGGVLAVSLLSDGGSSSTLPRSTEATLSSEVITSDLGESSEHGNDIRDILRPPQPPKQPAASPSAP